MGVLGTLQTLRARPCISAAGGFSLASDLLGEEAQGLALVADDMSLFIRDTGTPANAYSGTVGGKFTYTSPSQKWIEERDGVWRGSTSLRCEFSGGTALGIPVELDAFTNLTYPSRPSTTDASGVYSGSTIFGVSTYPTIAASPDTDPFGGTDAIRLTWNGVSARYGTPTATTTRHIPDGGTRSVLKAMFMRAASGTVSNVTLALRQTTGGPIAFVIPTLTTTWQRVTLIGTAIGGNGTCGWYLESSGTGVIDVIQYDLGVGTYITSPVLTTTASATRTADNISLATSLFPYSATAGTVKALLRPHLAVAGGGFVTLSNGTTSNVVTVYNNGTTINWVTLVASATQCNISTGAYSAGTERGFAGAYADNDFQAAAEGTLGTADVSGTLPTAATILRFANGSGSGGGRFHLRQLMYLPRRASNAELQTFSSP